MDEARVTKISKRLSYVLRHRPDSIGIVLGNGGWTDTRAMVDALNAHGLKCSLEDIIEVVRSNDKSRFAFDDHTLTQIRASQGHSIPEIDLQLSPAVPPEVLYHGTHYGALSGIQECGLQPMSRHHVHLSADLETARVVGARRTNKPIIFQINTGLMEDYVFYQSENGVWLVENVPVECLKRIWPSQ